MESIPNTPAFLPMPRIGAAQDLVQVTPHGVGVSTASAPRFATLWRETVATFVAQAGPVLVSAWVGFATTVAAIQGFRSLSGQTTATNPRVFLAGAVAGFLLNTLAQGALAWIGLHASRNSSGAWTLANALRATATGWRGLLPGALLNTLASFACALSLTPILFSSGLATTNPQPIYPNLKDLPRMAATRSLDVAVLGVLHPFGEWALSARIAMLPVFLHLDTIDPGVWRAIELSNHVYPADHREAPIFIEPMEPLPAGLIALAGLALMLAAEVCLRFNAAAAVRLGSRADPALTAHSIFGPLLESTRLGARHARLVLCNAVTLRLVMRVLQIVCLVLTTSAAEMTILPQLALSTRALWVLPVGRLAGIAASAAVSALLSAFCALFDARLYIALRR